MSVPPTEAGTLAGRTLLISGGSRGIGLAIARRAAEDGAKIALLSKTSEPHSRLQGTIFSAAEEIEAAGGEALPVVGDVRDEETVKRAVAATVERFGGIDVCINNASAIDLARSEQLPMGRYDLMQAVNTRGTFLLSRECVPHLRRSSNPHVLTLSPPFSPDPSWAAVHLGYTISKYGMSICTFGMAHEFAAEGIAFNSLWPRTLVATDAVRNIVGGEEAMKRARSPRIVAEAAHAILVRDSREATGKFFIDEEVLAAVGVTDLSEFQEGDGSELELDIFIGNGR